MAPLAARAPAKVNLTLRVGPQRADGLHEIESLVVFADVIDELTLDLSRPHGLDVQGPLRAACGPTSHNLVMKAASALAARVFELKLGHFSLIKRIPVAAGLGGGSADAAAALRLLAEANGLPLYDPRFQDAAQSTGADVPVCLDPRARLMRGAGEQLSPPLALPPLAAVLVNPGVALATKEVFAAYDRSPPKPLAAAKIPSFAVRNELLAYLRAETNDLELAAMSLQPTIVDALSALRALPHCLLARMSGSGATCFALFDDRQAAAAAAQELRGAHADWWIEETTLG
jgi:4-diphosphocytidyl-2-C-methyl-D-erythritol kinase